MASKDLLLRPPTPRERAHRRRAIMASFLAHGLIVVAISGLAIFFHEETKIHSGSPPGTPTITLSTLVIVSPPPAPPAPPVPDQPTPSTPTPPVPPVPEITAAVNTPPPVPEIAPTPPENALPVLPPAPTPVSTPVVPPVVQQKPAPSHPPTAHPVASVSNSHAKAHTQDAAASSYAPGASDLPHPPYPSEARSMGKTGTVVVNVQFNRQGGVTSTEVVQSSGVSILDSSTSSFIRTHWHSQAYAGQTISVPVQYQLQNL